MLTVREVVIEDVSELEQIFRRSVLSIMPSTRKILIWTIPLLILGWFWIWCFILLLIMIFQLGFWLYLRDYMKRSSPMKHINEYLGSDRNKMWKLMKDNEIIGFISLEEIPDNYGWISYLFVDPDHQGNKYSIYLIDKLVNYTCEHNYSGIKAGTSSMQNTLKLCQNYAEILNDLNLDITFEYTKEKVYWFIPIYQINICYTMHSNANWKILNNIN
jgi:hypothetical protein